MKATIYRLLSAMVVVTVLAMPMKALAHGHDGWHHDHGNHSGWYKHHGGYGYGGYEYPGHWHHHHDWYEHQYYGGYGYGYSGYPGNVVCDYDGDDCRPVPLMTVPWGY